MYRKQFKCLLLIIAGYYVLLIIAFLDLQKDPQKAKQTLDPVEFNADDIPPPGYVIKTPGCAIPELDISNSKIHKFFYNITRHECENNRTPLFSSNLTSIYLQSKVLLASYNLSESALKDLSCCYQYYRRRPPLEGESDVQIEYSNECINIFEPSQGVIIEDNEDFVKVKCTYARNENIFYEDYFHFISKKRNNNEEEEGTTQGEAENYLNIFILGLDSVSRVNLHRNMPKTSDYLAKLDAVEMFGYNKMADNTFPNLIAVLTGHNQEELKNECWPDEGAYFDKCAFIWDSFKENGFVTAFGEDTAKIGIFNFGRRGFQKQPTDYYYNHFDLANKHQCFGSSTYYKVMLRYSKNFALSMRDRKKKYFGFFWTVDITHDHVNMAREGDEGFESLLRELKEEDLLNNTMLIVMSDHGMRFGNFRNTYQGVLEDRLPFMFFVLPEWFQEKFPRLYSNLKTNKRRLVTNYDLHRTLLDLTNLTNLAKLNNQDVSKEGDGSRGISLFQAISPNRTCEDAGIDSHWCACRESNALELSDDRIIEAVNYTLNGHINPLLSRYKDCYQLRLSAILEGRHLVANAANANNSGAEEYRVTFTTKPGDAIFEATIQRFIGNIGNTDNTANVDYKVMGTVSRLNMYGDQSKCVEDVHMKLFCYCK